MAFINCESMFSLLLYIVTKYIIKCGYHGYMQLYIKALFNIALKKFAKMFSTKRKTKNLLAVRNIKCMYLNPTYLNKVKNADLFES